MSLQSVPWGMMDVMVEQADEFYEDDESVEELLAAYEAGPHVTTARPDRTLFVFQSFYSVDVLSNAAVGGEGFTQTPGRVVSGGRTLVAAGQ